MKITIPLGSRNYSINFFRRKKKKVYCKRCKWGKANSNYCDIYETLPNHISKKHREKVYGFEKGKQNKNNDCKLFKYDYFWWF